MASGKVLDAKYNWVRSGDPDHSVHRRRRRQSALGQHRRQPDVDRLHPGARYIGGTDYLTAAAAGRVATQNATVALPYNTYLQPYGDWLVGTGSRASTRSRRTFPCMTVCWTREYACWTARRPVRRGSIAGRVRTTASGSPTVRWNSGSGSCSGTHRTTGPPICSGRPANVWSEGEIDYPEASFGAGPKGYVHRRCAKPGENFSITETGLANWNDWHVYRIEWLPGRVSLFLDGNLEYQHQADVFGRR